MCEHSYYQVQRTIEHKLLHTALCVKCDKTSREVELEEQLSAANIRSKKLDNLLTTIKKYHPGHHKNCNYVVSDYEGKCDCGFREFQIAVQEAK